MDAWALSDAGNHLLLYCMRPLQWCRRLHPSSGVLTLTETAGAADGPGLGLERGSEAALQAMVYGVASFGSMDELLVYNALALRRRQLLRLQAGDEWSDVFEVRRDTLRWVQLQLIP